MRPWIIVDPVNNQVTTACSHCVQRLIAEQAGLVAEVVGDHPGQPGVMVLLPGNTIESTKVLH